MIVEEMIKLIERKPDHTKSVFIQDEDGNLIKETCVHLRYRDNNALIFDNDKHWSYLEQGTPLIISELLRKLKNTLYKTPEIYKYKIEVIANTTTKGKKKYSDNFDVIFDINGNLNFIVK